MRICIETRRDVNANVLLNQLYKHTQMQETFGIIMLALVEVIEYSQIILKTVGLMENLKIQLII